MSQNASSPDIQNAADQIKETIRQLGVAKVDPMGLLEEQHKNIEAMFNASQIANNGAYAIAERQLALFRETSKQLLEMFSGGDLTPQERTALAKQAFETALAGSRQVAEMAAEAGEAAVAVARSRIAENLEQMRKRAK